MKSRRKLRVRKVEFLKAGRVVRMKKAEAVVAQTPGKPSFASVEVHEPDAAGLAAQPRDLLRPALNFVIVLALQTYRKGLVVRDEP